jgi:ABC-type lipoprotein release transport system permease subunit
MAGRLAALVAITAASLGIFAGGLSAIDSTLAARDGWFAQADMADLELHFSTVPDSMVPDFSGVAGVVDARARAAVLGTVEVSDNPHLSLQLIAGQADADVEINKLVLLEGSLLESDDTSGVLIDWHLQDSHGVAVGDDLVVTLAGEELTLNVRGVVRDAEYLLAPANPSLFIPTKGSLGIGFVNVATLAPILGVTPVNSVLLRLSDDVDEPAVRQAILAKASDAHLDQAYALAPDEQFASLYLEKNLAAFGTVVPVIVSVTGLSSVFVTFFLLAQWLAKERRSLGVLMTLGHTSGSLARAFMVVLAILALGSIGVGIGVAYGLARAFIWQFAVSVGLPVAPTILTPVYLLSGCAAIAVVFVAAGLFAAAMVARLTPLDAMRSVAQTQGHPGRLASWLGARLPTSWLRIAVRNTVRDKVVSLLTVLSMALGFGITASFFIAFNSVIYTAQSQVDSSTWDLLVDFHAPLTKAEFEDIAVESGAADSTPEVRGAVQASANGEHVNVYVGGFETDKLWYKAPMMLSGHDINEDEPTGILIEVSTARELGVEEGDVVELDSTSGHFEAEIIGVFSSALPGEGRFTVAFAQEVFGLADTYTGGFLRVSEGTSDAVESLVGADSDVAQVTTRVGIKDEITALSDQITAILHLGASVSIVVALLFVLACLGYTVLKRTGDYQLLRCLGFRDRVVRATILTETGILGVAAMVLAIPIGAATAHYTGWRISQVWFHVDTQPTVADYAMTFIPALLLLPVVALPMARGVLKQSLDQFMRSRDVG